MLEIFFSFFAGFCAIAGLLLVVIGIHEAGHFLTAKGLGVGVKRVSLGFGKPFYSWKPNHAETEYCIAPFLIGGYVKLWDEREGEVPDVMLEKSFTRQPFWKRFVILGAGSFFNLIFAVMLFTAGFAGGVSTLKPAVSKVIHSSLAQKAGFEAHDEIIAVANQQVQDWFLVNFEFIKHFGEKGNMVVSVRKPDNRIVHLEIPLEDWKIDPLHPNLLKSLGIIPAKGSQWQQIRRESLPEAFLSGVKYTICFFEINGIAFYKVFSGKISIRSLAGPVSLLSETLSSFQRGLLDYALFIAVISIAVAVFNWLPVPGLDGFQMIFLVVEKVLRRPVSVAFQLLMFRLGAIALTILFIQVVLNDILRLLSQPGFL